MLRCGPRGVAMPKLKMLVYTNAVEGQDEAFNRWYDDTHVPEVLKFTKSVAAQRFRLSDEQPETVPGADPPPGGAESHRYLAIYEFDVDSKQAWASILENLPKMAPGSALDPKTMEVVFYDEIGDRVTA